MQSCGSICVVYGLNSRPSDVDDARREPLPVDVRIGDRVRVVVADRAVHLALDRRPCANAAICRSSRATTLAISLPSVVGVAGWPCVRASIGSVGMRVRQRAQIGDDVAQRAAAARRAAPRRARAPCARLLMSSDVHAKWMNSATRATSGTAAKRSFSQYSTALTSWLVCRSIALTRAASATENCAATSAIDVARRCGERRHLGDRRLRGQREQPLELDRARDGGSGRTR